MLSMDVSVRRRLTVKRPIPVLAWVLMAGSACPQIPDDLAALYRYDPATPLNIEQKELASRKGYRLYSISYALPKGGHMPGLLVTPTEPGRKPAIVWMHSGGAIRFLGNAVLMARAGAVSLLVGEAEGLSGGTAEQARDQLIADVIGLRRAADLLGAQRDVDPSRLSLVGHSSGAMMGAVAASVDDRFRSAVFEVGLLGMSIHIATSPGSWAEGVRKELGDQLPRFLTVISVVDAKNYIGHGPAIPKLFQSALQDPGVPSKDAEDFFKAATPPKELKWYDSGHDIDDIAALVDRARFLAKTLHLGNIERQLQMKNGR